MLDAAVFAAVAVVLGGVVAATARDGRVVVLGLMLAAVAASLVAEPWLFAMTQRNCVPPSASAVAGVV